MSLRIAFMGTPDFAVPTLTEIVGQGHEVVACYTRAPKAAGRGMEERKSPVHLVAERFDMGYLVTGLMFGGVIVAIAIAYYGLRLNAILAFWLAYILTRPLGASFGDLLSQPVEYGGLGFGTTFTSILFLGCIIALVLYMTLRKSAAESEQIALQSE